MSHKETVRRLMILTLLYSMPAFWCLRPVILDTDIWWHLQTGQWIIEHGILPTTDSFSSYGLGKPWIAYSWLFEVLMYGLYRWLGLFGIVLYPVILGTVCVAALHRLVAKREPQLVVAAGIIGLAIVAISVILTPRPWLFTVLFFTLTVDVVLDLREGRSTKTIWLLPLLYALWANLHIQFVYGLAALALACAAPILDWLIGHEQSGDDARVVGSQGWWRLVTLTGCCVAATLLNPYHVHLYGLIVELAMQANMYTYISELLAPDFREAWAWAMLGIAGAAAMAIGRRGSPSSFDILMLVIPTYFAFRATRDAWFLVIAAVAILSTSQRAEGAVERFILTKVRALLVAGVVAVVLIAVCWVRDISERHIEAEMAKFFPVNAAAVVEERDYSGPLYNHFNWGGYLIWRLPHLPVSMDGRTNVHGDERIKRSLRTWEGGSHWSEDSELDVAAVVIAQKDMALASLLRLDPRFQKTYQDETAVVFMRVPGKTGQSDLSVPGSTVSLLTTTDIASAQ